ncbi:hypothetical protein H7J07_05395 [Mycobacterium koreense]|uniref:Uncharacterized protein n=1 Tax=Mycolicibacillus koreensis TaxID=1069220 RepID=A0A7I7SAX5_9MYCO|nr:hypothetical protein [Mycolicibacillus koreensis]MCV7247659.1 hypothetical protein [Mycolicibacillus koreensis]OSC30616.1 hypothetical protein B8W67_16910 [Mycolicibacillus koreensis]BBY54042.1 hypothetical protein MKOR_12930 [Mycolicibacillus koreensis]
MTVYRFCPAQTPAADRYAAGDVEIVSTRFHRASSTGLVYEVRNLTNGRVATAMPGELDPQP